MHTNVDRGSYDELRSVVWWAVLGVATASDYLTTRVGLAVGYPEANPLAAGVIDQFGLAGAVVVLKLPALLFVATLWLVLPTEYRDVGVETLAVVWSAVVLWNGYLLLRLVA